MCEWEIRRAPLQEKKAGFIYASYSHALSSANRPTLYVWTLNVQYSELPVLVLFIFLFLQLANDRIWIYLVPFVTIFFVVNRISNIQQTTFI